MGKKVMSMAIINDFKPVLKALNLLCDKKYLNKSRILREAIRKEVQELLKQYPDVADNLSDKGVYFIIEFLNQNTLIKHLSLN